MHAQWNVQAVLMVKVSYVRWTVQRKSHENLGEQHEYESVYELLGENFTWYIERRTMTPLSLPLAILWEMGKLDVYSV